MRLGIDTGGTFTDAVLYDSNQGIVKTAKALTTHYDLSVGILEVIEKIDSVELPLSENVQVSSISTTLATNAIVEGRGGSVCLILIGHRSDALERGGLRGAIRDDPVVFLQGGHTAWGEINHPLDIDAAQTAIIDHASSVSAFAVASIFSVRNTEHEVAIRDLILQHTDRPATCTFELTASLDAPRRATTAVLNARLIAPISKLIETVRTVLINKGVTAPLMVVKGDGSMMSAEVAMIRPVETILSGPAASIVGAVHLAQSPVTVVADIGGTTTDVAVLHRGKPRIAHQGALVGNFRTFVEAVDVYTVGLGGDSHISMNLPLTAGPNRAMPISSLGQQHPQIQQILKDQRADPGNDYQGCFLLRRSKNEYPEDTLGRTDRKLWELLELGPVRCDELFQEPHMLRAYNRLRILDLVHMAAFTPTDALHVLGKLTKWSIDCARLGAEIWMNSLSKQRAHWDTVEAFCDDVIETVVMQSCISVVSAIAEAENQCASKQSVNDYLLNRALDKQQSRYLNVQLQIPGIVSVVGAPASSFYPQVAERLGTQVVMANHFEIGNAIGAAIGTMRQKVSSLITSPAEGIYRAHTPSGIEDFKDLEDAVAKANQELEEVARQRAVQCNTADSDISLERNDIIVNGAGGRKIFIESRLSVIVQGDVDL